MKYNSQLKLHSLNERQKVVCSKFLSNYQTVANQFRVGQDLTLPTDLSLETVSGSGLIRSPLV